MPRDIEFDGDAPASRRYMRKISSISMCPEDVFGDDDIQNSTPEESSIDSGSISSKFSEIRTPWTSIYVATGIAFVQAFQFSIFVASIWNYVKSVDHTISPDIFGYLVGAYSLGQAISSPLFGFWSNKIEKIKMPLFTGLGCMLTGNALYFLLYILPGSKIMWLILARFITGLGAGNSSLLRAYVSTASLAKDRSKAIAFVTAGDTMGTTSGPLFQIAFLALGTDLTIGGFPITKYNVPALFAVVCDAAGIILIALMFIEDYSALAKAKEEFQNLPAPDFLAVAICVGTRFSQAFMMTNFEGTGNMFVQAMFDYDDNTALRNNNLLYAIQAFIGFLVYFLFITCKLNKILRLRLAAILSLVAFISYFIVTYPFDFYSRSVSVHYGNTSVSDPPGCDASKFSWCYDLKTYPSFMYYLGNGFFLCVFFPIFNISLTTLFSKIIGPRRQGTMQGVFQLSGALAKMSGPPIMTNAYQYSGPKLNWQIQGAQLILMLLVWLIFLNRMVPIHRKNEYSTKWCCFRLPRVLRRSDIVHLEQDGKAQKF